MRMHSSLIYSKTNFFQFFFKLSLYVEDLKTNSEGRNKMMALPPSDGCKTRLPD